MKAERIELQLAPVEAHNVIGVGDRRTVLRNTEACLFIDTKILFQLRHSQAHTLAAKAMNDTKGPNGCPMCLVLGGTPSLALVNKPLPDERERLAAYRSGLIEHRRRTGVDHLK